MMTTEETVPFSQIAPTYHAALMALGQSHQERAVVLGVSTRQVIAYLQGDAFPQAHVLKRVAELDAAFTADLAAILPLIRRREGPKTKSAA